MIQILRKKTYNFLRWGEKYTKTDMVYLTKGGFWLNLGQFATAFISFGLSIAFANFLSRESYGTYGYILSIGALLGAFSLSGLPTAVTRSVAMGYEGSFMQAFWVNIRWGIIIAITGGIGAFYYLINDNIPLALGLLIVGAISPIIDSTKLYGTLLNGKKNFKLSSLLGILRSLFVSMGIFVSILITQNPIVLVLSYFILHSLATVFSFIYIKNREKPNSKIDVNTLRLGKHLSLINSLSVFSENIDRVLVFHFLGPIQLAIYSFALVIPNQLSGFIKSVGILAVPKFAQQDRESVRRTILNKSLWVLFFGLIVIIFYVFFAPIIFNTFFPQYLESVKFSQVYSLILLLSATLPVAFLDSQIAIKSKYKLTLLTNMSKLILLFVGVFYYGLWGLIIARILSKAIGLSYIFYLIKREV